MPKKWDSEDDRLRKYYLRGPWECEWRRLPIGPYEVSEYGDLRHAEEAVGGRYIGQVVRGFDKSRGYIRFGLRRLTNGQSTLFAHRAVAFCFIGESPSPRHHVAHYDGNRHNNHWSNLRWATAKENAQDMLRHDSRICGQRNHKAILTEDQVINIRAEFARGRLPKGRRQQLCDQYGITNGALYNIKQGRNWKHLREANIERLTP